MKWYIPLIVVFAICFMAIPAMATDSPNVGIITDSKTYQNTYFDTSTPGGATFWTALYFNKIESINTLVMVKGWDSHYGPANDIVIARKPISNSTYETVWFKSETNHQIIGSGVYGYSIDLSNNIYAYIGITNGWDIGILNGTQIVDIVNSSGVLVQNDQSKFYIENVNKLVNVGSSQYNNNDNVFPAEATDGTRPFFHEREVDYSNSIEVSYIRTPETPLDIFSFSRIGSNFEPTYSNIVLNYLLNGNYQVALNDTSSNEITNFPLLNGTAQTLTIINPITNDEYDYSWGVEAVVQQKLAIYTRDGSTGQILGGTNIQIVNDTTHSNTFTGYSSNGIYYYNVPVGYAYSITGSISGYTSDTNSVSVAVYSSIPIEVDLTLYPIAQLTAGNGTQAFIAEHTDPQQNYLTTYESGVAITISNTTLGDTQTKFTNSQGYAVFIANDSYTYSYSASKTGEPGAIGKFNMGGSQNPSTIYLMMTSVVPTPTQTITPISTPTLATQQSATSDVSNTFYNAGPVIAVLVIMAIIMGLIDLMGGQRRRRY